MILESLPNRIHEVFERYDVGRCQIDRRELRSGHSLELGDLSGVHAELNGRAEL